MPAFIRIKNLIIDFNAILKLELKGKCIMIYYNGISDIDKIEYESDYVAEKDFDRITEEMIPTFEPNNNPLQAN